MSACIMAGAIMLLLPDTNLFTLEWTHSVERQQWRETWAVEDGRMRLTEAAVKGSGAGMEPGEGGRFENGWWVWTPTSTAVPELVLAASGETQSGWTICARDCRMVGADPAEPLVIRPCDGS